MNGRRISIALNVVLIAGIGALGVRWLLRRPPPNFWIESHMTSTRDMYDRLEPKAGSTVLLGDSLTEYGAWAELLDRPDVYNRGIGGDTAPGVRTRLDSIVRAEPRVIALMIGFNDLSAGRSPEQVVADIEAVVGALREGTPRTRLIVQSVLPARVGRGTSVSPETIVETNRGIEALCQKLGVEYLDVWSKMADADRSLPADFTVDGVHLNGAGYQRWASVLGPALR
jgi:lysophospholipase L1-like esterase